MIIGQVTDVRSWIGNGRLSVAYSPIINLPQINSDNDNSVRARSSTRDALIVNANVRARGLAARQNRFLCKNGTPPRYSTTIRGRVKTNSPHFSLTCANQPVGNIMFPH